MTSEGMSISESSKLLNVASIMGRRRQKRWNEAGYEGLKPRYRSGRPSKLTQKQKDQLIQILKSRNVWTTNKVRQLILNEFGVEYSLMQIRRILKEFGMKYAKPYQHDYRKPADADEILKKIPELDENTIIGFLDATSPQNNANTLRLWAFNKPRYTGTRGLK